MRCMKNERCVVLNRDEVARTNWDEDVRNAQELIRVLETYIEGEDLEFTEGAYYSVNWQPVEEVADIRKGRCFRVSSRTWGVLCASK